MSIASRLHLSPAESAQGEKSSAESGVSPVPTLLRLLTLLAVAGIAVGAYFGLVYAATDTLQGNVQRIFYFHVSAFSAAAVGFALAVFSGIMYLIKRDVKWDRLAVAGIEAGLFLSLITLITGMVWARPIWNTWWTWDPRLTSAAIMCLTYAAYLMLRSAIDSPDKRRAIAAVYGILAFGTVAFTFIIIRVRPDTIHPTVIGSSPVNAEGGFSMTDTMKAALGVNSAIWCCLIAPALIWWRLRLEKAYARIDQMRAEV